MTRNPQPSKMPDAAFAEHFPTLARAINGTASIETVLSLLESKLDGRGTLCSSNGQIIWSDDFDTLENEEPHDVAWSLYCETAELIREALPSGWVISSSDSDNDSVQIYINRGDDVAKTVKSVLPGEGDFEHNEIQEFTATRKPRKPHVPDEVLVLRKVEGPEDGVDHWEIIQSKFTDWKQAKKFIADNSIAGVLKIVAVKWSGEAVVETQKVLTFK